MRDAADSNTDVDFQRFPVGELNKTVGESPIAMQHAGGPSEPELRHRISVPVAIFDRSTFSLGGVYHY